MERGFVGGISENRDENRAVDDQEVCIAGREATAIGGIHRSRPRQGQESKRIAVRLAKPSQLSGHCRERFIVLVPGIVAALEEDRAVGCEAGEGIDMGVGVIPGQCSVRQPQDGVDSEGLLQDRLDFGAGEIGVSALQAGEGTEQMARTIAFDRTPSSAKSIRR